MPHHGVAVADLPNLTLVEPNGDIAELLHVEHRVAAEDHGFALGAKFIHSLHALFLERKISNRERLVDNEDVGAYHCRNRKRETYIHARRVGLYRPVYKLAKLRELDDVFFERSDVVVRHAEQRGIEENIAAASKLGMEPCAQLEQRGNLAVCRNLAASRLKSAHEQFQQRRLAGSVIADDAEALAIGYGEGNISQHMVNLVSRTP